jgi:hypothetical protein
VYSAPFPPVSKPHTHIAYMLRQCTSIVHIFSLILLIIVYCVINFIWCLIVMLMWADNSKIKVLVLVLMTNVMFSIHSVLFFTSNDDERVIPPKVSDIKLGLFSGCDSDATDFRCRFQHRYHRSDNACHRWPSLANIFDARIITSCRSRNEIVLTF